MKSAGPDGLWPKLSSPCYCWTSKVIIASGLNNVNMVNSGERMKDCNFLNSVKQMGKWNDQHATSVRQRKNLSPRQDSNLWPPKHRAGALSTWATKNSWRARPNTYFNKGCFSVAQVDRAPTAVWEVIGSIPVGVSDFFFVPRLWHADHFIFTCLILLPSACTCISPGLPESQSLTNLLEQDPGQLALEPCQENDDQTLNQAAEEERFSSVRTGNDICF